MYCESARLVTSEKMAEMARGMMPRSVYRSTPPVMVNVLPAQLAMAAASVGVVERDGEIHQTTTPHTKERGGLRHIHLYDISRLFVR